MKHLKQLIITLILVTLFCISITANSSTPTSENPIRIAHPAENANLPNLKSTFVFGSVPPEGKLFINGMPVTVHSGGGYLTMINLSPGEFKIQAELQLANTTYHFTRTINVAEPEKASPKSPLTIEYVTPQQDVALLPGDYVEVVCKGSPDKTAYFTIKGSREKFPMVETNKAPGGIYHGSYRIKSTDNFDQATIKVTLVDQDNRKESLDSNGRLSIFPSDQPVMVETNSANTILRAGPAISQYDRAGYLMFPPAGTILQATGSKGDEYRLRLNATNSVWVNMNQVKLLPKGTHPNRVVVGSITTSATNKATLIRIPLERKLPFRVDANVEGNQLDLTLFGAYSNTDWITNAPAGIIKQIQWFQDDSETYRLRIQTLPKGWWGYDARYEGNQLVLELRTPPALRNNTSPLAGIKIAIDAGHSPDTGAIGPTGYMEKDANLAIALNLKEKLLAQGAEVIMIREGNEGVALLQRPLIAWENKADLLISIHNNALGYGQNPLLKRGFGVYYYTPMSKPLAQEIHTAYLKTFNGHKKFNLPNDGLFFANLALTRPSQMPAVLIESAYQILPEEESYLKQADFRSACANAIVAGIESYLRQIRSQQ